VYIFLYFLVSYHVKLALTGCLLVNSMHEVETADGQEQEQEDPKLAEKHVCPVHHLIQHYTMTSEMVYDAGVCKKRPRCFYFTVGIETVQSYVSDCRLVVVVVVEMNIIKVALSHFCCRTTVQSDSVSVARQVTVRRW